MFALIETNGATHIAISIPKDGAAKSLPAIAAMLEHNATFFRGGWNDLAVVQPKMSITLGDTYTSDHRDDGTLLIRSGDEVIDESFEIATPELFLSVKEAKKRANDEMARLRAELEHTKQQLTAAKERADELERRLVATGQEEAEA